MKYANSVKVQLGLGLLVCLVSYLWFQPLYLSVLLGVTVSIANTILDKLFIYWQQNLDASSGKSFAYLILSVLLRLTLVICGLYLGFTLLTPKGVIIGFVITHVGYMIDKLSDIK